MKSVTNTKISEKSRKTHAVCILSSSIETQSDSTVLLTHVCRYVVTYKDIASGRESKVVATALVLAIGLLGQQCSPEARGMPSLSKYTGVVTYAGREKGADCALGHKGAGKVDTRAVTSMPFQSSRRPNSACSSPLQPI
jgi:hypothetical protein